MAEGSQTMSELIASFEKRHEKIRGELAELKIVSEETLAPTGHETFGHSVEKRDEEDCVKRRLTRALSHGNIASHSKLHRTSSEGFATTLHGTRRKSLSMTSPLTETLPKLPLRRLSSDTPGSDRHFVQRPNALTRMYATRPISNLQGGIGTGLNAAQLPLRKQSFPQEKASSLYSPQAQGHHLVARRRSAPYSASRPRRPSSSSAVEAPKWRIRKHQRSLIIDDDDDDSDTLGEGASRKSSSSSGFWSQSSFESV